MDTKQKEVLDRLARMQRFLDQHRCALIVVNKSQARAALDELLRSVEQHEIAQHLAEQRRRGKTTERIALRRQLRCGHLQPIVTVGRVRGAAVPSLAPLRMPKSKIPDATLVTAALSMAMVAGERDGLVLDEGLPADFVDRLLAATESLRAAASQHAESRNQAMVANRELAALVKRGRGLARVLDTLVLAKVEGNARLTALWKMATAVQPVLGGRHSVLSA